MEILAPLIHYTSIALTIVFTSFGVGIGSGWVGVAALTAVNKAPQAHPEILKASIIGLALVETGALLGVVMAMLMLSGVMPSASTQFFYVAIAEYGITLALGISGFAVGLASALPAQQAMNSIARQPLFSSSILNIMILSQSIIQTPAIFAFIIGLLIKLQLGSVESMHDSMRYLASGLCIGIGSIGPIMGLSIFAKTACQSIGINRSAYSKILPFTFMSQAIIETPIIFALLISLVIISQPKSTVDIMLFSAMVFSAALATGIGTGAPGVSSGKTAAAACKEIAINPSLYSILSKTSFLAQGLIDTAPVYALLISLLILLLH